MTAQHSSSRPGASARAARADDLAGSSLRDRSALAARSFPEDDARARFLEDLDEFCVATLDLDWTIRSWNRGAARILGVPADTAVGTSFLRFVPAPGLAGPAVGQRLEAALERGGDRVEAWLQRRDGSRFWAACVLGAIRDDHGVVSGLGLVVRDINEHQESTAVEEETRRRVALQHRLERIAETAPGVLHEFCLRPDGTMCFPYASAAFERVYGLDPALVALDASLVFERIHAQDRPRLEEAILQSAATLALFREEFRLLNPERGEVWIEASSAPTLEPDGSVVWHGFLRDVTERKRLELELERHRRQLEEAQRVGRVGSFEYDIVGNEVVWSAEHRRIFGIGPDAPVPVLLEDFLERVHPFDRDVVRESVARGLDGNPFEVDYRILRPDGSTAWIHAHGVIELDADGRPVAQRGTVQDVTDRRSLEEQLRQSQKIEAIGRLAGGVAHDFNNLLTVINGHTDLLLMVAPETGRERDSLESIRQAGEHAANLTRRLLAFSRRQVLDVKTIDLDSVVTGLEDMLRRLVGDDVTLDLRTGAGHRVRADVGQIEQVLLNLVVNARDAMPRGGQIAITTASVEMPAGFMGVDAEVESGRYVELVVSDTGSGMTPEVAERAFEPFFTTKETGKGTGLGLAMVFGIVRQSGGYVAVDSAPGHGTSIRILLPAAVEAEEPSSVVRGDSSRADAHGGGTVLLVEDDAGVRQLAADTLRAMGFRVLQATDGRHALLVASGVDGPIDLLLSDVVMPHMGGIDLALELRALRPEMRIALMSGHTSGIDRADIDRVGQGFLTKPFSTEELGALVRSVLAP
jgi:PAS domain S-box-containing protein